MICAFTGHRPERLPWGLNEADPRCAALKTLLRRTVREVYDRSFHTFLCGMARGCDQYFAEAVLAVKADGARDAQLCAMIPCPSQPDGWDAASVARYWALLDACDRIEVLEDHYSPGCMLRRNRYMVDHSQLLLAVHDGSPGGTRYTIEYALRQRRDVLVLPVPEI